ncbi:MAG: PKD domain-containing protein [Ginsengibacter sp.]
MKFFYSSCRAYIVTALLFLTTGLHTNAQTLNAHPNVYLTSNAHGYYDYLPLGYNPSASQTYPVLIAFGGLSQNGDGSAAQLDYVFSNWGGPGWQIINGKFPSSLTVNGQLFRFIVILPQFSSNASPKGVDDLISYVIAHYKADPSRIYLTGNSSGGGTCWDYPGASVQNGLRVAAIVPTCAAASYNTTKANNIAAANLPVWATHNKIDPTVSPNTTINFVNGINAAPVPPNPRAKMTIFNDSGHNCADSTFNTTYGIGAYAWMLQYKRGSAPPANQPPVANAGADVNITLPANSVQLNGNNSYDPDGTITYSWAKIAGPSQFSINNSTIVNPVLSNLVAGTYTLRLTVTDNNGATATDDINITVKAAGVNQPPVANAGPDVILVLPANSVTLNGSGTDPDGTITKYAWAQVSGPSTSTISNTSTPQTTISNLVAGVYVFKLTVTDNNGATDLNQMQLTVKPGTGNQPPVADAGPDVILVLPTNSVTINGVGTDPDGTITKYAWSQVSGPSTGTISSPATSQTIISNLITGTYIFKLTVTDNNGASTSDQMQLTVKPSTANLPPVANAGPDIILVLPTNSVTLYGSGTDPDGTITNYVWTQVLGPSTSSIGSPASPQTTVSNLVAGRYVFKLTVTDNNGATDLNQMQLTVKPSAGGSSPSKYIYVNLYGGSNPYNNAAWNNWNIGPSTATNISSGLFNYSDGTSSNIKAVISNSITTSDNGATYGSGMAPPEVLRYSCDNALPRTLTISGLSTSLQYSIDLYASRYSFGNSTIFTINGSAVTVNTYNNLTNAAVFTNISPNTQGQIVVDIKSLTSYNYLNGFKITEQGTSLPGFTGGMNSASTSSGNVASSEKPGLTGSTSVKVFPNPVANNLLLEVNNPLRGNMKVDIISASGAVVKQMLTIHSSPLSQINIKVSELPAGVYLVKVQIGNWFTSKKIIKSTK